MPRQDFEGMGSGEEGRRHLKKVEDVGNLAQVMTRLLHFGKKSHHHCNLI